jgi:hypothetical protein
MLYSNLILYRRIAEGTLDEDSIAHKVRQFPRIADLQNGTGITLIPLVSDQQAQTRFRRVLRKIIQGLSLVCRHPSSSDPRIWRNLSIDLVAAALRQRKFATKITGNGSQNTPLARRRATLRYRKFILLMDRRSPAAGKSLVPTLDIDLC